MSSIETVEVRNTQVFRDWSGAMTPEADTTSRISRGEVEATIAVILLILTSPLILLAMLAVRLTSRGPVIYTQTRAGRNGREFQIHKIRTMLVDCEKHTGPRWSTPGDPRVTPVGWVLRMTHIDELPQLWNIIRGEMRLVGPRPERPEIIANLSIALPRYQERTMVSPGVTGLAQVQLAPDVDLDSVRRKLACDLHYIQVASPWLDTRIIVATGLGILGIPFSWSGRLLRIPSNLTPDTILDDEFDELSR